MRELPHPHTPPTRSRFVRAVLTLTAAATLAMTSGCAFQREFRDPETLGALPSETVPLLDSGQNAGDGVVNLYNDLVGTPSAFMVKPMREVSKDLPDIQIKNLSVTESGLQEALQMAVEGTGLSLHFEGGPRALERNGPVSVHGISGSLSQVLDRLSESMGFFWSVGSDRVITIQPDSQYVIELPPAIADDTLAGMTNTIQALGAKDVYLDRMARSLVLRVNTRSLDRVEQYMARIRETRSLVVYELQIYQVDLSDTTKQGVDWSKMGASSIAREKPISLTSPAASAVATGTTSTAAASDLAKAFSMTQNANGLGAVLLGPKFNIDLLVSFLKTQGTVKTVSQPRLAMLNGTKGLLRVGQTTTYVSKVGSNLGTGITQVTVETKDLRTGLQLALVGDESDNTIYTRVSLSLSELLRFQKFTALGTDLTLPEVSDRDLETNIRLPAGYSALLGGITVQRSSNERGIGAATNTLANEVKQSEIVIVLKPTVVRFNTKARSAV